ncbi:hypothetical protein R69608_07029 [Paraburkholderia nemoris]|uniref:hypothetical protein n=1 Tax=Paraburkholderia nemoris TaxID=2793076 RepID=UPI0019123184|nr:hypothetical protein [Paraburkholderia nemoris]MBK5152461.1 hypothetical protein [Burkholderia sp. R-69608]CAE6967644.1 hypothetical protein R69608_07029 [Paraburkholderia nemoris]
MEKFGLISNGIDALFGKNGTTVLFTNLFAVIFALLLLWLCERFGDDRLARFQNYLIVCLGALLGWALGMFFSPYGTEDEPVFAQMGKLASVFISGYAVSKIDRFIEASMFDGKNPKVESWIRVGLFVGALTLSLLTVVSNRLYYRPDEAPTEMSFSAPALVPAPAFEKGVAIDMTMRNISNAVYRDVANNSSSSFSR